MTAHAAWIDDDDDDEHDEWVEPEPPPDQWKDWQGMYGSCCWVHNQAIVYNCCSQTTWLSAQEICEAVHARCNRHDIPLGEVREVLTLLIDIGCCERKQFPRRVKYRLKPTVMLPPISTDQIIQMREWIEEWAECSKPKPTERQPVDWAKFGF